MTERQTWMPSEAALVLFSGGQDSTTCLAWALERYKRVETIGFDYGQRHRVELSCRELILQKVRRISAAWGERLGNDHLLSLDVLGKISETALTRDVSVKVESGGLPNTFVPGRNLVFLTLGAAVAYRRGLRHIVGGVCETDFSGYPDCRDDVIKLLQATLNLGMEANFILETPLMWIDKSATWALASALGGDEFIDLILEETHTCYLGERGVRHSWGYGCGSCPACLLRATGYEEFISKK